MLDGLRFESLMARWPEVRSLMGGMAINVEALRLVVVPTCSIVGWVGGPGSEVGDPRTNP